MRYRFIFFLALYGSMAYAQDDGMQAAQMAAQMAAQASQQATQQAMQDMQQASQQAMQNAPAGGTGLYSIGWHRDGRETETVGEAGNLQLLDHTSNEGQDPRRGDVLHDGRLDADRAVHALRGADTNRFHHASSGHRNRALRRAEPDRHGFVYSAGIESRLHYDKFKCVGRTWPNNGNHELDAAKRGRGAARHHGRCEFQQA